MAQQTINIGAAPDDGTGDTLRDGGDKINDNFTELYTFDTGVPELIRDTIGTALVAGTNITITPSDVGDTITIDASSGGAIEALDEGVTLTASITSIDFVGAGVTASNSGGDVTVTIAGGGGYNAENARDDIGAALVGGSGITVTVNDGADTITIASAPSAIFEDQKAANTAGGGSTSGSWGTRVLNTSVYNDIPSASLSSNQISLPAGTYEVDATSAFFDGGRVRARLQDVTNAVTLALSEVGFSDTGAPGGASPRILGRFTLAGTVNVELQYRVQVSQATNGLGAESNFGVTEIYARVKLTKLA